MGVGEIKMASMLARSRKVALEPKRNQEQAAEVTLLTLWKKFAVRCPGPRGQLPIKVQSSEQRPEF